MKKVITIIVILSFLLITTGCKNNNSKSKLTTETKSTENSAVCDCPTTEETTAACQCWEDQEFSFVVSLDREKIETADNFNPDILFSHKNIAEFRSVGIVPNSIYQVKTKDISFEQYAALLFSLSATGYVRNFDIPEETTTPEITGKYNHDCDLYNKKQKFDFKIFVDRVYFNNKIQESEKYPSDTDFKPHLEALIDFWPIDSYEIDEPWDQSPPGQFRLKTKDIYYEQFILLLASISAKEPVTFITLFPSSDYFVITEDNTQPSCCIACLSYGLKYHKLHITTKGEPMNGDDFKFYYSMYESLQNGKIAGKTNEYNVKTRKISFTHFFIVLANLNLNNMSVEIE